MQNQVFNADGVVGSESSGRIRNVVVGLIGALVLVVVIAVAFTGQRDLVTESEQSAEIERALALPETGVAPQDSSAPATYTQRYWDLAAEREISAPIAVEPKSFSTQQYWDLAAEHAQSAAPAQAVNPVTYTQQYWDLAAEHAQRTAPAQKVNPVTYTQQYWDLAAEHAQRTAPAQAVNSVTYTQQYWDLAAEHAQSSLYQMSAAPRSEDAFYTERYWKMAEK